MIEQQSGKIVNISSINGEFVFPNAAAYNASKAGVLLLTKSKFSIMLPYLITVIALAFFIRKTNVPAALGKQYIKQ